MWLSGACRAAVQLIRISLDWKWQEEALIFVSYEADLNSYPKWWCPPRSHYASSLCPSSQPLSFITSPSSCPQFSIAELPSREHLGYQPHWVVRAFPPPLVSLGTRGGRQPLPLPGAAEWSHYQGIPCGATRMVQQKTASSYDDPVAGRGCGAALEALQLLPPALLG